MWNWNIEEDEEAVAEMVFLIEPMWNWNKTKRYYLPNGEPIFNWTNVELKQKHFKDFADFRLFLIEPMWNWNNQFRPEAAKWIFF